MIGGVLLSMALIAAMWWVYFTGDDERGLDALADAPPERMARDALWAYALAHLVMIAGLVLVAVGLHEVVHEPRHHLTARVAVTMAAGVGVYLLGEAMFRRRLGLGSGALAAVASLVCLTTIPLGTSASGLLQLGGLVVVMAGLLLVRDRRVHRDRDGPVAALPGQG